MSIIVWSKVNCPQCDTVKQMLKSNGFSYEERVIGTEYTVQDLLSIVPTAKSVPQVFVNGEHVSSTSKLAERLGI